MKIDEKPNTRGKIHSCLEMHFDLKQKQKIRGKLAEMANISGSFYINEVGSTQEYRMITSGIEN